MSDLDLIIQAAELWADGSENCNQIAAAISRITAERDALKAAYEKNEDEWIARETELLAQNLTLKAILAQVTEERGRCIKNSQHYLDRQLDAEVERDRLKQSLARHICGNPHCICAKCCREEDDAELSALPSLGC